MKKLYFLLLLLPLVVTVKAQSNAFDEAMKISAFLKNYSGTADTVLVNMALDNYVRKNVAGASTGNPFDNGSVPQQNPAMNNAPVNLTANDQAFIKTKMQKEIDCLKKLSSTDCFDDLDCPDHFEFLDYYGASITGVGNSGIGNINFSSLQSTIIQGLTDFFISRAKAELVNVYLGRWYDTLSSNAIVQPLIPHTLDVYDAFLKDNAIDLAKYGDKWKAAFQEDIRNIPVQFQDTDYVNTVLSSFLQPHPELVHELEPVITGGDRLVYNLYLKKNLVNILSDMSADYMAEGTEDPAVFKRCIIIANLLADVCGTMDNNSVYTPVKFADLKKMDIGAWKCFIKLFYVRNSHALNMVLGQNSKDVFCSMVKSADAINQFAATLNQTIHILGSYQFLLSGSNSNAAQTNELSFNDTRKIYDISFQLVDNMQSYFMQFQKLVPTGNAASLAIDKILATYKDKIQPFLSNLSQVGAGISTAQYGDVVDGAVNIFRQTIKVTRGSNGDTVSMNNAIRYIQKYGSFMLNILTAKDANNVETALDELIPKSQYDLKNHKAFTVALSGYPGVFAGVEGVKKYQADNSGNIDYTKDKKVSWKPSLSAYLPIGIDLGFCNKNRSRNSSTNIFFQAIDLGAVLNYRLTTDSTESTNPDISFKQLLSPGLSVMRHFKNSPLVIGAGMNYTPDLRTIKQDGNQYGENSLRFGVFLSVDVTMLFFHISKN